MRTKDTPPVTSDIEGERLRALRALGVLDTPPEAVFDALTALAASTFNAPIALVSLLDADRQWFKSCVGLDVRETGRDIAFCEHAIRRDEGLVILDARKDPRFSENPLVVGPPHIRFYAGAPLILRPGVRLGTLCVIDSRPRRSFGPALRTQLRAMARAAVEAMAMRRDLTLLHVNDRERAERERLLAEVETLAGVGHWSWDPAADVTTWSRATFEVHGVDPGGPAPSYAEVLELYHPDDRATLRSAVETALRTGAPYRLQARVRRPDGGLRHVRATGEPRLGPDGSVTRLSGLFLDVTDVVLADEAVRANERRLTYLTENASDIILRVSPGAGVTWASPSVRRLGYAPEALLGKAIIAHVHPEDLEAIREIQRRALRGEGEGGEDARLPRFRLADPAGGWRTLEAAATTIRGAGGEPLEVVNILRDVTLRRRAEDALAASEARYRLLAENATDVIACFGPDARFTYLSPSVRQLLGYAPEELLGRPTSAIMHPEDHAASLAVYRAHLAGPRRAEPFFFEYRAFRKDGAEVWLAGHPKAIFDDATGALTGFTDVVRDVTERRAMQEALAVSETRFRLLAENSIDIIMKSGPDGRLRYVSPAVTRITGHAPEELLGRTARRFVHPQDWPELRAAFQAQVESAGAAPPRRVEYRLIARDGREVWMESAPRAVLDAATGTLVGVSDVARDVTARRRLEAELALARDAAEAAARVKADFLANMSHEIRTPLTAILGFTSLLKARSDLPPEARASVERVSGAGAALLALVNDVLDFSKLEAGQMPIRPRPTPVRECLAECLALFEPQAAAKGVALRLDCAAPEAVETDPDRLRQILLNLLGNAVKFTERGAVTLRAGYDGAAGVLRLEVEDTGPGLDADQAAALFQRFAQIDASSTRRHGGTGLGLAICRGLAEAMGGAVGLESRPGAGSTFWVTLAAPECAAPDPAADEAATQDLEGLRLLVVDDNRVNRELVRVLMEPLGVSVREAADGLEALEAAAGEPFDLILMDIRMPRCNGPDAVLRLRAEPGPNQDVPVLAFSADYDLERFGAHAARGFDGLVKKPISRAELMEAVLRAVGDQLPEPAAALG